jgi:hypothetical protein
MKIRFILFILGALTLVSPVSNAQTSQLNIQLEEVTIPNLGGLQSYAFGQADDKWLLVGGRLDGLHRRQPWASFDVAGHNNQIWVVDPENKKFWSASLSSLPPAIAEQLSSTNMDYYQEGDYLYCVGGYGYSDAAGDHVTYDKLTAIDVPKTIDAVINAKDFTSFFRQITDSKFQVTGGQLKKIGNVYHLLGGQKFMGRYNPMGPDHGPGFIQEYTNSIRRFTLSDNGTTISINHLTDYTSQADLHRRDYNAETQILPNGKEGVTMFSGVFRTDADLPFLNCVNVNESNYELNDSFEQKLNHYHCPTLPLYSAKNNEMHTLFFGGMAQFYYNGDQLVEDTDVPFVKTIGHVTRNASGAMQEQRLATEMPGLLGAGAEFIPNTNLSAYANQVIKLDELTDDTTVLGFIYGGISSTGQNIFFINNGSQSSATSSLYRVKLIKETAAISPLQSNKQLNFYPNPSQGRLKFGFYATTTGVANLQLTNVEGKVVWTDSFTVNQPGDQIKSIDFKELSLKGTYFLKLTIAEQEYKQKLLIH